MTRTQLFFSSFATFILGVFSVGTSASAQEYVWARTMWGSSNVDRHYGTMTNGYGGYYVPRTNYGNNYEATGGFTNPHGFIIPAQTTYAQQSVQTNWGRRHARRR